MNSVEGNRQFAEAISAKFMLHDDKDDQDILDQHVSRVWSDMTPHRSPGNHSPSAQFQRKKPHEMSFMAGGSEFKGRLAIHQKFYMILLSTGIQSSMRSSKSMPDSNMRKFSKWGSVNTDSGISLFSSDTMTFKRDSMSISGSSSSSVTMGSKPQRTQMLPPEAIPTAAHSKMAQQLEDVRRFVEIRRRFSRVLTVLFSFRSKRYLHQPPLPQKNVVPPPLPAKNLSQPAQITPPAAAPVPEQTTIVMYSLCDEDVPYRTKISGRHPLTLKQFKDCLHSKGNYR
jgi:axin 1